MNPIYASRRRKDIIIRGLCVAAAAFGIGWLTLILGSLLWNGLSSLGLNVFTQMTPPPGVKDGGLLNAIVGSLIMTVIGVAIGAPLGMFAGTYLAEYGRHDKLSSVIRFINDILLSAPSIIIGLFIYGYNNGVQFPVLAEKLWDSNTQALFASIIAFHFGGRAFGK